MKFLLVIVSLITLSTLVSASDSENDWEKEWKEFKSQYNKEYKHEQEEMQRKKAFVENMNIILEHNQKYEIGLVSHKMGPNEFSDMSHSEFVKNTNGHNKNKKYSYLKYQ